MRMFYQKHKTVLDKLAFFSVVILGVAIFFKYLFGYVAPFFLGFLIAVIMEPLIGVLVNKGRFKRGLASGLCMLLFIAVIGSLGTALVSKLTREAIAFVSEAPSMAEDYAERIDDLNTRLIAFSDGFPDAFHIDLAAITDSAVNTLLGLFGDSVKGMSVSLVSNAPMFFVSLVMCLVSAFFFMKDKPLIYRAVSERCPKWLAGHLRLVRRGLSRAARGYFKAQFILMSIVATIAIAGLLILRNPYALLVGLVMAVFDFLPIFGSGTILLPWTLLSLLAGNYAQAIGLLVLYGVITVTRQSLEPKILGEQIGLHPLITLMSVFVGLRVFGFLGIIVGPSLVIISKAIYHAEKS